MTKETRQQRDLRCGTQWPYDGNRPEADWAHKAARGVCYDLSCRRGIRHVLEAIDDHVAVEIVDAIAAIIREAASQAWRVQRD